ncbi:hypothetical protein [Sporomusa malonica]|uniref:hypothetical protein n=1 Tax=Sporomusa malonica TaxID=112901 RepID=UPI00111C4D46|nr:hypothetical protein [Sporomusa malonica]
MGIWKVEKMGKNIWLRYAVYSFFGLLLLMIVSSAVLPALSMNTVQGGMAGNMNMGQMPMGYTNISQMPMGMSSSSCI